MACSRSTLLLTGLFRKALFSLLALFSGHELLAEAVQRGQVTASDTGLPIEGATVTLDLDSPPDGDFEYTAETDPFGFYEISDITPGDYEIDISHPAYLDETPVSDTFVLDTTVIYNKALTPKTGSFFDIYVQVADVTSGIPLADIPVTVERYAEGDMNVLEDTLTGKTDTSGNLVLRGQEPGHYRFIVNQDNASGMTVDDWETFTTEGNVSQDKQLLLKAHTASILLKPVPQDLKIKIIGFHPSILDYSNTLAPPFPTIPLENIYVELTGVEEDDEGNLIEIVPTRTGITDDNGEVEFKGLPGISWRVETRRIGYEAHSQVIPPEDLGNTEPLEIELMLRDVKMFLVLEHPYINIDPTPGVSDFMRDLEVRIQGLDGTNTEGIDFIDRNFAYYGAFYYEWRPIINSLLPGRYRLSVNGSGTHVPTGNNTSITPHFFAETYVDVTDVNSDNPNLNWTDVTLNLQTTPATIRGRLFVADEEGLLREDGEDPLPLFVPANQEIEIEFVEYVPQESEGVFGPVLLYDDPENPGASFTVKVMTDETGEFTIQLPSTNYGIRIPSMTEHWGSHIRLRDYTTTINSFKEFHQGWPYYTWPHDSPPPSNGTPDFGEPIVLRSGHDYDLDLFVMRQQLALSGIVFDDSGSGDADGIADPTPGDLVRGGTTISLTPDGGGDPVVIGIDDRYTGNDGTYRFSNVQPGDYTISASHPRNTFTYEGSPSPLPVTVPSWDPPGVVPAQDPNEISYIYPFQEIQPGNIQGEYTQPGGSITFNLYRWNGSEYDGPIPSGFFNNKEVAYSGKVRYGAGIPVGSFKLWKSVAADGGVDYFEKQTTGDGSDQVFDVYYNNNGQGLDNVIDTLPQVPYNVTFRIVSADDPGFYVPGTTVTFQGVDYTPPQTNSEFTITNITGARTLNLVSNDNWTASLIAGVTRSIVDTGTPEELIIIRMERATRVQGKVTISGSSTGLPNTKVQVRDRYGDVLNEDLTDENGDFVFAAQINGSEPLYIDYLAPGYIPQRVRFDPGSPNIAPDPEDNATAILTADAALASLPDPVIGDITLDRAGIFLPGVTYSQNAGPENLFRATDTLTMEWTVTTSAQTFSYDLPPFDAADGTAPQAQSNQQVDPVTEVWLVDPRMYGTPEDPENPAVFGNPYGDDPTPLTLPDTGDYTAVRSFLDGLGGPAAPGVFFSKADMLAPTGTPNELEATGEVELWNLPPGDFEPVIFVLTHRGAVTMQTLQYAGDLAGRELEGIQLPPWLAFAADAMAAIAGAQETAGLAESFMPEGRFTALPEFAANIDIDPENDGFLLYDYDIGVSMKEGMDTPGSGLIGLAPGILGLQFDANAGIDVLGNERKVTLGVSGQMTADDIDYSDYASKALKAFDPEITIKGPTGGVSTELSRNFSGAQPYEFEMTHAVNAETGLEAELNLKPITGKLPYVGPVLTSLDKTGAFKTFGTLDATIGLDASTTWRTLSPIDFETGTDLDPHVQRRHFLGGAEQTTLIDAPENKFDLLFNFGVGVRVDIARGRAGAAGAINLTGNEEESGKPNVIVSLNTDGDWPPIKRVQGSVTATLEAFLDAWVTRFEKDWEWELVSFDHQFGTETEFELIPMNIMLRKQSQSEAPQVIFDGDSSQLVRDFNPLGIFSSRRGDSDMMLYTEYESGEMKLKLIRRSNSATWEAPLEIGSGAAILDSALIQLPSDEWMAVWTEIEDIDIASLYPPSRIRYSIGDENGENWSMPAILSDRMGVALELTLITSASITGLVFIENASGPGGETASIWATEWDDDIWEIPVQLLDETPITAFTAACCGLESSDEAQVLYIDDSGDVYSMIYDGDSGTTPAKIVDGPAQAISLDFGPGESAFLAVAKEGAPIQVFSRNGSTWTDLETPLATGAAIDLSIASFDDDNTEALLLVWTLGSDAVSLHYGFIDPEDGSVLEPAWNITRNTSGIYSDVSILTRDGFEATILSRFSINPTEIRQFDVSLSGGILNSDADSDGMDDTFELLIVDADTEDGIVSIDGDAPDGVRPGDDFDGDFVSNLNEFLRGTDPTDPLSFPMGVTVEATNPVAYELANAAGEFTFMRPENTNSFTQSIMVAYSIGGTASPGSDYTALTGSVEIPANQTTQTLIVNPLGDNASEGDETVILTLSPPDPTYITGLPDEATVTIKDLPIDDWRFRKFLNPDSAEADDSSDPDNDGIANILEYALYLEPDVADIINLPTIDTDSGYLTLTYRRANEADDLTYTVEVSTDLTNWMSNSEGMEDITEEISNVSDGPDFNIITVRDKTPISGNTKRFIRLHVSRPE